MSANGRPLSRATRSARSISASSGPLQVTIQLGSLASSAPRQALGPPIGVVQIDPIGAVSLRCL
jgi:hypothetical protein